MLNRTIFRDLKLYKTIVSAMAAFVMLQPLGAHADQCEVALSDYKQITGNKTVDTIKNALPHIGVPDDDLRKGQQQRCDDEKAWDDLVRSEMNSAKQVEQACKGRVKLQCGAACLQKSLSKSEEKTATDCSTAALDEAARAQRVLNPPSSTHMSEQEIKEASACALANVCVGGDIKDPSCSDAKKTCSNSFSEQCRDVVAFLKHVGTKIPSDLVCRPASN